MDPWSVVEAASKDESVVNSAPEEGSHTFKDTFADNFCDKGDKIIFEKLPDSDEYLKLLESKLHKLTGRSQQIEETKRIRQTLVQDLSRTKEDTLANLLANSCDINNAESEINIDLEQSVIVNPVIRRLLPDQPLTAGERVFLTRADHLEILSGNTESEENSSSAPPVTESL